MEPPPRVAEQSRMLARPSWASLCLPGSSCLAGEAKPACHRRGPDTC